ncbi:GNAT family N-acetyltransferase [Thermodesulfobacteriota bacterium]
MGNRGRYGKYGETKRFDRLRRVRTEACPPKRPLISPFRSRTSPNNILSQESSIALRPARDSDAYFIKRLSGKIFNVYGPYEEYLPKWFESDKSVTIVACVDRQTVGYAMIGDMFEKYNLRNVSELLAIAVDPKKQRKGIGGLLLREVDRKAIELNIERIFLHTATKNLKARRLFIKNGYRPWEIKGRFYPEGQDAIVMSKEPSTLSKKGKYS